PDLHVTAAALHGSQTARGGALADGVEDHVVEPAGAREVLSGVVDHHVSAERLHELQVARAAYAGDACPEVPCELNGKYADASGGSVDEHALSGLDVELPDEIQRRHRAERGRRGFLECHVARLWRQRADFGHADVLGMAAELE